MKTIERHRLKENEIAVTLDQVRDRVTAHRKPITTAIAAVIVLAVLAGGYWFWSSQRQAKAAVLLAEARSVATAPDRRAGRG